MPKVRVLAALALIPSLSIAQQVASPTASFVDVPARIALLSTTQDPLLLSAIHGLRSCEAMPAVAAPAGPMRIPHHYVSGSHGPINPDEAKATAVYGAFERRITAGMNQYVATGSHAEAQCALDQIQTWASANALMNYDPTLNGDSQSWFQVEWTLSSIGTTLSVLVNDSKLDPAEVERITRWLDGSAHRMIGFEKPGQAANNHHYWRGLAAISISGPAHDDSLLRYGVSVYQQAIAEIDSNGAFPLEMARHERSIHYQSFALQALILIAEFAEHQHIPLYAYSSHDRTVRDAVRFLGRAIDDPSVVTSYTTDAQDVSFGGSDVAPFVFYSARFGTADLGKTLAKGLLQPTTETRLGGSTTVLAAAPAAQ